MHYVQISALWLLNSLLKVDLKKCENNNKNNNNEEGTAESVKGQRAVAPLTLIRIRIRIIMRKEQQNQ